MNWLYDLFFGGGIAHAVITFALVITLGILLGKIKVKGISLGITWILFVGIVCSHFGMTVDDDIRHFVQEFGFCSSFPSDCRWGPASSRRSNTEA